MVRHKAAAVVLISTFAKSVLALTHDVTISGRNTTYDDQFMAFFAPSKALPRSADTIDGAAVLPTNASTSRVTMAEHHNVGRSRALLALGSDCAVVSSVDPSIRAPDSCLVTCARC